LKSDFSFKSKKNKVILSNGIVEKHMKSNVAATIEATKLKLLFNAGVRVPKVISQENNILKLEYVKGTTITDFIEYMEFNLKPSNLSQLEYLAECIISWLNDFYNAVNYNKTGEIRGDINLRNFIFDNIHCWGIDFEEQIFGTKEQDIGRMLAFILCYHPPNTYIKNLFVEKLLNKAIAELSLDQSKILKWRVHELEAINIRRSTPSSTTKI